MNYFLKTINYFTSISLLLLTTSCQSHYLNVQTHYLSHQDLASFRVNTPDPAKETPIIGQRLMISWSLPKKYFNYQNLMLRVKVRFKDYQEDEVFISIYKKSGTYFYDLAQDEYLNRRGISTYKVELVDNNTIIYSWQHPLWMNLITFEKDEKGKDA